MIGIAVLLLPMAAGAGEVTPSGPRHVVHVVNIGPGDHLESRFGHIALMVDDHRDKTRTVYNFGTYDFSQDVGGGYLTGGELRFWLSVRDWRATVEQFRDENRALTLRRLNLTPAQADEVARRLVENARPENREYVYHHSEDNCSTRVRDLIDAVLGGAFARSLPAEPAGVSYRGMTSAGLDGMPLVRVLLNFAASGNGDRPVTRWQLHCNPDHLAADLDAVRLGPDGDPLVAEVRPVLERAGGPPGEGGIGGADALVFGVLLALFALGLVLPAIRPRRKGAARWLGAGIAGWGLVAGLGGALCVVCWVWIRLTDTHGNENLLVTPVTHLWLVVPGAVLAVRGRLSDRLGKAVTWYLVASLVILPVSAFFTLGAHDQWNWPFVLTAAICNGLALLGLTRIR